MGWSINIAATVDLGGKEPFTVPVYEGGDTYNVGPMYHAVGRPTPSQWPRVTARELEPEVRLTLAYFRVNREALLRLNPANGWGSVDNTIRMLREVIYACQKAPVAVVEVY